MIPIVVSVHDVTLKQAINSTQPLFRGLYYEILVKKNLITIFPVNVTYFIYSIINTHSLLSWQLQAQWWYVTTSCMMSQYHAVKFNTKFFPRFIFYHLQSISSTVTTIVAMLASDWSAFSRAVANIPHVERCSRSSCRVVVRSPMSALAKRTDWIARRCRR